MSRPPLFPGEPRGVALALKPWGFTLNLPEQADALSDPALDVMADSLAGLLPTGAAWRSPDGVAFDSGDGSLMAGLIRALAGELRTLYRKVFGIAMESTASTVDAGLEDWEAEYGLPDPCLGPQPDRALRIRSLVAKVRSAGTITTRDFVALAAALGFRVTIEEPTPFECSVSECGEGDDEISGVNQFLWIVHVGDTPETRFECGASECGLDRLLDFPLATALECVFRAIAPAWTRPVFDYGD